MCKDQNGKDVGGAACEKVCDYKNHKTCLADNNILTPEEIEYNKIVESLRDNYKDMNSKTIQGFINKNNTDMQDVQNCLNILRFFDGHHEDYNPLKNTLDKTLKYLKDKYENQNTNPEDKIMFVDLYGEYKSSWNSVYTECFNTIT